DLITHRHILERPGEGDPFIAALEAAAQGFGFTLASVDECFRRSRRNEKKNRTQGEIIAGGLVILRFHGGQDVLFADLQARLVTPAYELWPRDVSADARLQGGDVDPRFCELLGQLLGREPQPARHRRKGGIDLGIGNLEPPFLGLAYLELFIDQLVDDLLTRRDLVCGQLRKLAALLDIEGRDRLAADDDNDLLRVRRGRRRTRGNSQHRGQQPPPASLEKIEHARSCNFPCRTRPCSHGRRALSAYRSIPAFPY